ncbi:hypothetical protein [Polaribacter sp. Asnod6-C07]|uniref:hypothetical protein n=1 Tax=Polaribacter sp. Asnod6-C07 TaxID=3160582 RepID=UPI0038703F2B
MKKFILLFTAILLFNSCLNDENNDYVNYGFELLPIDEYIVPSSFTFGEKDTIKVKYTFKNDCYSFDHVYYEYQDTTRIVAIQSLVDLDKTCTEQTTQYEFDMVITVIQEEDYIFKFWKGEDNNGENIFEEVVVPVN